MRTGADVYTPVVPLSLTDDRRADIPPHDPLPGANAWRRGAVIQFAPKSDAETKGVPRPATGADRPGEPGAVP
jgi:hypothetical protein